MPIAYTVQIALCNNRHIVILKKIHDTMEFTLFEKVKIYKSDNTCNTFHNIDKPAPWFVFKQRFVAKNSTSVNLLKRFETHVIVQVFTDV